MLTSANFSLGVVKKKTQNDSFFRWYFVWIKHVGFKYEPYLCNGCHDLMQRLWILIMLPLFMLKEMITELIFGIWVKF